MSRLQSVDVVRVAAVIAVIAIHTTPFSSASVPVGERLDLATVINQLARFAVPFFFVLSGYFWGHKIATGGAVIASTLPTVKRTALLLLFWSIIYLVPTDWSASLEYGLSGPLKTAYWNLTEALQRPGATLLEGTMYHLWFLPALVCSLVISAVLLHYGQRSLLVLLAVALFLTGLAGGAYRVTPFGIDATFNFRNGPFFSLVFFVSGYLLSQRTAGKSWLPVGIAVACAGALLQLCEVILLNQAYGAPTNQDYVFGTYFFGVGVAMIAISNPSLLRRSWAAAIGQLVLGIYASHVIFVRLLLPLDKKFEGNWLWSIAYVGLVFVLPYMLARFLARFKATKKLVM